MRNLSVVAALLLLFCITACHQSSNQNNKNVEITDVLSTTRTLLSTAPDSALLLLNAINRNQLSNKDLTELLYQTGVAYGRRGEFAASDSVFHKALQIPHIENDTINKATILVNLGVNQHRRGLLRTAIAYYRQARTVLCNHPNKTGQLKRIYMNTGTAYMRLGEFDSTSIFYRKALDISIQEGDREFEADILANLALLSRRLNNPLQMQQYSQRALYLYESIGNSYNEMITVHINLGVAFANMGKLAEALYHYQQAESISIGSGISSGLSDIYHNMGVLYHRKRDWANSLTMLNKSLEINRKQDNLRGLAFTYQVKGSVHNELNDYERGLFYGNKALELTDRLELSDLRHFVYHTLLSAHIAHGNVEEAVNFVNQRDVVRDSLLTERRLAALQELQVRFETEQKRQEILLQEEVINRQRATIGLLAVIGALAIVLFVIIYLFQRQKLHYQIQIVQKHEEIDKTIKKELRNETTPEKVIEFSDEDKTTLHNFQQLFENDKIYRTQNLSVVTVAEALGVNKNHLSHLINNYYQRNFSEYTNHYRVEEAKEIFKKQCNNYTMQHIAEIVGFTYRTTFNDVFKKIVGITPSEYKRVVKCMK